MDLDDVEGLNRANQALLEAIQRDQQAIQSNPLGMEWPALIATLIVALGMAITCMIGGAWVANQRGRSKTEGALLGLVFGVFGVLIEALLPEADDSSSRERDLIQHGVNGTQTATKPSSQWMIMVSMMKLWTGLTARIRAC